MTHVNFNWKEKSMWKLDYDVAFMTIKNALVNSMEVHFPDYSLPWLVRGDASDVGCFCALIQIQTVDGKAYEQIIGMYSHKWSAAARKWQPIQKEGYIIFAGIKFFSYFLRGKFFVLETDHRNLLWMERNPAPMIQRWVIELQAFCFLLRHIAGNSVKMKFIDERSRAWEDDTDVLAELAVRKQAKEEVATVAVIELSSEVEPQRPKFDWTATTMYEVFDQVHRSTLGYYGARATLKLLNKLFPGHCIPYHVIADMVATCPICQKFRLGMVDQVNGVVRHLVPEEGVVMWGVDLSRSHRMTPSKASST